LGPYLVGKAVDQFRSPQLMLRLGTLMLAVYFTQWLAQVLEGYLTSSMVHQVLYALRRDLFEHLQTLSLSFFDRQPHGELMSRLTNDIEAINACMRAIVGELKLRLDTVDNERQKIQQQLLQAYKIEGLGTMATGVAHDFNNFLAAVLGNASIVLNHLPPDAPARDNALQIQATAQQAVELTSKLALFSGHMRFHGAPVSLTDLVREQAAALEGLVFRGVQVEYHLDESVPIIQADRNQLGLLLRGLVQNAAESIISRRGRVTVTTGVMEVDVQTLKKLEFNEKLPEGAYAYLEVSDTGSGIPDDVRHRMFDPFFSTKIRGQGMGLGVALGVARAHLGGVLVETSPDNGSAFRVILPCPETVRRT